MWFRFQSGFIALVPQAVGADAFGVTPPGVTPRAGVVPPAGVMPPGGGEGGGGWQSEGNAGAGSWTAAAEYGGKTAEYGWEMAQVECGHMAQGSGMQMAQAASANPFEEDGVDPFFSSLLLSSLELRDTKVYGP